jgi:hypothetical protein
MELEVATEKLRCVAAAYGFSTQNTSPIFTSYEERSAADLYDWESVVLLTLLDVLLCLRTTTVHVQSRRFTVVCRKVRSVGEPRGEQENEKSHEVNEHPE